MACADAAPVVVSGMAWPCGDQDDSGWQDAVLAAELAALGTGEPPPEEELYGLMPDAESGAPVGDADDLPVELLIAQADAEPAVAAPEPFATVLCDAVGADPQFAAGGVLDVADPGPALAGFAAGAWARLKELDDDQLIGVVRAWRRLSSWAAAGELAAADELLDRRERGLGAGPGGDPFDCAAAELACALTLTRRGAARNSWQIRRCRCGICRRRRRRSHGAGSTCRGHSWSWPG